MTSNTERQKTIRSVAEMIKEINVAMLTTAMPDGVLRSRPMISAEPEFHGELWFFTEFDTKKVQEIKDNPQVNASFALPQEDIYVSISGTAELVRDQRKAEILWKDQYQAWLPNDVDPSQLGFLKVAVDRAEYWDASTSRMEQISSFTKAVFGGRRDQPVEHGKIEWPEEIAAEDPSRERKSK
jgi:general stress protein 26